MAVLVFVLNITLPTESVKKEQQSTIVGISLFDKKLAQYVLLDDRVKNISSLISKRKNYVPNIYKIFGKISDDTSVDMLSIQTGQLALTVSSGSLPSINKFIDDLVAFGVSGKIIKNVIIQGLTLNVDSGKYSLSIKADIL
jgi:hypothetical protein